MSISFEDAVDEILTGKKKTHTEASLAQRLKEHAEEKIDIKKILHEDDDPQKGDEQSLKKRIQDKEQEDEIDDNTDDDSEDKEPKDVKAKKKEREAQVELEKKKRREFIENLEKDDVILSRFKDVKYKLSKDPEGEEVLRTYVRIDSKNVDIKRFGSSEILQYGKLEDILGSYGYSLDDLAGPEKAQPSVEGALAQASDQPPAAPEQPEGKKVNSFLFVIKKINDQNSGAEILCASKSTVNSDNAGATVTIFGKTTSFDDRRTALDSTDLQYQQLVLTNITGKSEA